MLCYDIHAVIMASSSSSSHLSIDDAVHQVQVQIKDVLANIQTNGDILKQSSDEKEKDFLRAEILLLRQKEDRLHQEKVLLLQQQQQEQQRQQQAGKTVLYDELYLISYGLHYDDNNHRVSSLSHSSDVCICVAVCIYCLSS